MKLLVRKVEEKDGRIVIVVSKIPRCIEDCTNPRTAVMSYDKVLLSPLSNLLNLEVGTTVESSMLGDPAFKAIQYLESLERLEKQADSPPKDKIAQVVEDLMKRSGVDI